MIANALGRLLALIGAAIVLYLAVVLVNATIAAVSTSAKQSRAAAASPASRMLARGRRIFRYDTFGDQAFWGGALQLHRAIAGRKNGGVGPGVSPKTALSDGLLATSCQAAQYLVSCELRPVVEGSLTAASIWVSAALRAAQLPCAVSWLRI